MFKQWITDVQAGGGVILQLMNKAKYLEHKKGVVEEKRENNETPLANNYHCTASLGLKLSVVDK